MANTTDNPGTAVEEAVRRCLSLVDTWIHWDARPRVSEDGDRIYTPHKAVRRIADHLVDHLAEVEALLARVDTQPDAWHGSLLTLDSDWARFTEADRDEAHQRLRRLARTFALRLAAAGPDSWDEQRDGHWTLREIAGHLTGVLWYAEQVGDLTPRR
jgi:DNA-binding transcriptional MerR regulator